MQRVGVSNQLELTITDKTYPGADGEPVRAVRDFSLTVAEMSFTALIGPSGCGKSTILRILSGLDKEFTGQVHWAETPRIGFVFQEPRLLPWRTIEKNILLSAHEDFSKDDLNILAKELGIDEVLNRFPTELSLGLARRVSLARAFAYRPNVLLLDEPFVSLDEPTAQRLRGLLAKTWSKYQVTAIMVTHNISEAVELADRLIFLKPRPTSMLAEVNIDLPQGQRSPQQVDAVKDNLKKSYPQFFASA